MTQSVALQLVADPPTLPRPELREALQRTPGGSVVALLSPSGYGKSTLVRQWLSDGQVDACIIDAAAAQEERDLASAIATALPRARLLRGNPEEPSDDTQARSRMTQVLEVVAVTRLRLIIDDCDAVLQQFGTEQMQQLVDSLPGSTTLVLSGTSLGEVNLNKLSVQGRVNHITADQLAFSVDDLRRGLGRRSPSEERLLTYVGGWPTGVGAILRKAHSQVGEEAESVSSLRRDLAGYIRSEVLGNLSTQMREFLQDVAIVGPLDTLSLTRIRERPDTRACCAEVADNPPAMVSVEDPPEGMIHLAPILRDILDKEMLWEQPDRRMSLLGRTAVMLEEENRQPQRIFDVLSRMDDRQRLIDYVMRVGPPLCLSGQHEMVRGWMERFNHTDLANEPELGVVFTTMSFVNDDISAMWGWYTEIERHWAAYRGDKPLRSQTRGLMNALAMATFRKSDVPPPDKIGWWTPLTSLMVAFNEIGNARDAEARGLLTSLRLQVHGLTVLEMLVETTLAYLMASRGEIEPGRQTYAAMRQRWDDSPLNGAKVGLPLYIMGFWFKIYDPNLTDAQRNDLSGEAEELLHALLALPGPLSLITMAAAAPYLDACLVMGWTDKAVKVREWLGHADEIAVVAPALGARLRTFSKKRELESTEFPEVSITSTELKVLEQLQTHKTVPEIAALLSVSPSTVRSHVRSLYNKLEVHSRGDLVIAAKNRKLLPEAPRPE